MIPENIIEGNRQRFYQFQFFQDGEEVTRIVELLPSMYYDMTGKYFYFQWFCITRLLK